MFWKNFEYLNLAYRPKMLARLLRYCCLILYENHSVQRMLPSFSFVDCQVYLTIPDYKQAPTALYNINFSSSIVVALGFMAGVDKKPVCLPEL